MKEELLKGLSEEQIAKVKACKSQEEILALAKEEDIELTDQQLEAVSGGGCSNKPRCPFCQSEYINRIRRVTADDGRPADEMECNNCHAHWNWIQK